MHEVVFAKYFAWVLNGLIGNICRIATQIQGRKSFLKYQEQEQATLSNLIAGDITNIAPIAICESLRVSPVGRAEIIKRNQLRQNGDLAGLDFVVNRTAYSFISRFYSRLESSCDYIIASLLAYPTGISVISSFPLAYLLFLK